METSSRNFFLVKITVKKLKRMFFGEKSYPLVLSVGTTQCRKVELPDQWLFFPFPRLPAAVLPVPGIFLIFFSKFFVIFLLRI